MLYNKTKVQPGDKHHLNFEEFEDFLRKYEDFEKNSDYIFETLDFFFRFLKTMTIVKE
jgi:hypothetical protein